MDCVDVLVTGRISTQGGGLSVSSRRATLAQQETALCTRLSVLGLCLRIAVLLFAGEEKQVAA